jgi:hypothetical protein
VRAPADRGSGWCREGSCVPVSTKPCVKDGASESGSKLREARLGGWIGTLTATPQRSSWCARCERCWHSWQWEWDGLEKEAARWRGMEFYGRVGLFGTLGVACCEGASRFEIICV